MCFYFITNKFQNRVSLCVDTNAIHKTEFMRIAETKIACVDWDLVNKL